MKLLAFWTRGCVLRNQIPKMLSQLSKIQSQLLRLVRNRQDIKGFVQPLPKVSMRKEVHSKQNNQIRQRLIKFRLELEKPQDQHRNQCCPNLNLHGISARAYFALTNSAFNSEAILIIPSSLVNDESFEGMF